MTVSLLAIVDAFKNWRHHLEDCKHEVFVLIDHSRTSVDLWIQRA